ncbi:MAG: hypothetical protein ABGY24_01235 [bacterium]
MARRERKQHSWIEQLRTVLEEEASERASDGGGSSDLKNSYGG